jgi:hypothetical protein
MAKPLHDSNFANVPLRPVKLGAAQAEIDRRAVGTIYLRSPRGREC